ncbi:MAG: heavy-metal-associated domain-containing protein [Armatimonadota bacterium]
MVRTVNLTVTGEEKIHCAGCEQRIAHALRRLPGIQDVQASAQSQRVVVKLDAAQISLERVRAKLKELGYHVAS